MEEKTVRRNKAFVGVLGVRVDPRTRAAATLEAFLGQFDLPVLAYLRDSQIYPNAAFNGLSIFDLRALFGRARAGALAAGPRLGAPGWGQAGLA